MVGISAALNYTFGFISKKIYYELETTLSLPGVSLLFSCICGTGLVWMYFILPETENRTLEDIELHFSDDSKNLTDRKIVKATANSIKEGAIPIVTVSTIVANNKESAAGFNNKAFETESTKV